MNLEKYVVVTGMPGVHKIISTRAGGLIIEDKLEKRTRFVALRPNQMTLLASVGVYVETEDTDTLPLGEVWQRMFDALETVPPPPQTANSAAFRAYFNEVLPEHDADRVHINDIKKCLKWFSFALDKGVLAEAIAADAKVKKAEEATVETADEAPPAAAETETAAEIADEAPPAAAETETAAEIADEAPPAAAETEAAA